MAMGAARRRDRRRIDGHETVEPAQPAIAVGCPGREGIGQRKAHACAPHRASTGPERIGQRKKHACAPRAAPRVDVVGDAPVGLRAEGERPLALAPQHLVAI